MSPINLVIADDHPIVRKAVINTFRHLSHINFVGEANHGEELFDLIQQKKTDFAIIDLKMPAMDGYDTLLRLHTEYPEIKVIVFSGFLDRPTQVRAIEMGAFATVSKLESPKVLIHAVEGAIKGERFHSKTDEDICARVLNNDDHQLLTLREKQILNLIAEGKTSKQIGQTYNISQWTVNKHRSNIKEKLKIKNLAEMIRYAIEQSDSGG